MGSYTEWTIYLNALHTRVSFLSLWHDGVMNQTSLKGQDESNSLFFSKTKCRDLIKITLSFGYHNLPGGSLHPKLGKTCLDAFRTCRSRHS